jgi:hypothetical protein
MRPLIIILCCGITFLGCTHSKREVGASMETGKPRPARRSAKGTAPEASANQSGTAPQMTPLSSASGKVVAVNSNLRFVVVDFFLSKLPQLEQRLGVYRQGQKVGEVRISGPEQRNNIVADVVAGEAKIGDEVRPD